MNAYKLIFQQSIISSISMVIVSYVWYDEVQTFFLEFSKCFQGYVPDKQKSLYVWWVHLQRAPEETIKNLNDYLAALNEVLCFLTHFLLDWLAFLILNYNLYSAGGSWMKLFKLKSDSDALLQVFAFLLDSFISFLPCRCLNSPHPPVI